jgi:hypothetical protein
MPKTATAIRWNAREYVISEAETLHETYQTARTDYTAAERKYQTENVLDYLREGQRDDDLTPRQVRAAIKAAEKLLAKM